MGQGGRKSIEQIQEGRARDRKPFIHRVCSAQRVIGTMVSEGARPWGRGRSGFADHYA